MKFNRILICCSLNPKARTLLLQSIAFANAFGKELFFCHVGQDIPETRCKLFFLLEDLNIKTSNPIMIRAGQPDKAVCHLAKELGADLIMAGALAHENTISSIFGSVARRIVRQADCSVFLLPHVNQEQFGFKNIAININYDGSAKSLMSWAIDLSHHFESHVHAIHEQDYRLRFLHSEESGNEQTIKKYEHECAIVEDERLKNFLREFNWKGIVPTVVCLKSGDGGGLFQYSQAHNVDLILMPTPVKRISFWDRFFHSPLEIVLQDLPCSILFYRLNTHG